MKPEDLKNLIAESIKNFSQNELTINALNLFNTLGYNTARQSPLDQPSYQSFKNYFVTDETNFNETKAITCDWNYVDLLFQLTKDEVLKQTSLFDTIVYELYFPEEIKTAGCEVLKHLTVTPSGVEVLPELKEEWTDEKKLKTIEKVRKELSSSSHPVSIAMQKMQEVEEVRIIEGKQ